MKNRKQVNPKTGNACVSVSLKCRFEHENKWKAQHKRMNCEIRLSVWFQKKLWKQRSAPTNHHPKTENHNMEFTTAQYKKTVTIKTSCIYTLHSENPGFDINEHFWSYQMAKTNYNPSIFYTLKIIYMLI